MVDTRDDMGWTSLRAAVNFGHLESARLLLEHGAHVDIADNRGPRPAAPMAERAALHQPAAHCPAICVASAKNGLERTWKQ